MAINPDDIYITGEPQTDPHVCKFIISHQIFPGGSVRCSSKEEAAGSPLLEALFAVDGIAQALVYGDTIVLVKDSGAEWPTLGAKIGPAIRQTLASSDKLISEDLTKRQPSEEQLRARLEELFASQINSAIASHGGRADLVDVKGTAAYITFSGGCQGCSASSVTLKQGIEQIVLQNVPEITQVIDMTDHAAGTNPFYK